MVGRNYRCQNGEIDLIYWDQDELVFVEVKTRKTNRFGTGEEAITEQKELRLASAAYSYLLNYGYGNFAYRIDLAILQKHGPGFYRLSYLRGVIGSVHDDALDAP